MQSYIGIGRELEPIQRSGEYATEVKKDRHEHYLTRVGLLPKALPGIVDGKRELTGPRSVNILVLNILAP